MKFENATQNGITLATPLKTRPSNLGLAISTTASVYGDPVLLKAVSNAAMWKTEPVTFYSDFTPPGTSTVETIELGTVDFSSTTTAVLVGTELNTGTHQVYASWPGEGRYAAVSTEENPLTITINSATVLQATFELQVDPANNTLVVDEGTATFTAVFSTFPISKAVTGDVRFYIDGILYSLETLENNQVSVSTDTLTAGPHTVQAVWAGGEQADGIRYQGVNTSTVYTVASGTNVASTLTLSLASTSNVFQEGTVTLTANLSGVQILPGSIGFYANGSLIGTKALTTNTAAITVNNTFPVGNNVFVAVWDGNGTTKPKYIPKTSSPVSLAVVARATPPALTFTVGPNPTAFGAETTYKATFNTSTSISGTVEFYDTNTLIGSATLVSNSATIIKRYLSTGTHIAYARYLGSSTAPKYYSTASNTASFSVSPGLDLGVPMTTIVKGNSFQGFFDPYVQGETLSITAQIITDDIALVGDGQSAVVDFYHDGVKFNTTSWSHYTVLNTATNNYQTYNVATATYTVATTGTHSFYNKWNGVYTNQYGYILGTQSTTTSITVLSGYNTPARLTLSVGSPRVIGEDITYAVTVADKIFTVNTVTIFANDVELATVSTTSNTVNITTNAITVAGNYNIKAFMPGNVLLGNRYNGTYSNVVSIAVAEANTLDGSIVLTASTSSKVVAGVIGFRAVLTGTNVVLNGLQDGAVSFTANGIEVASTNFVNNVATFTDSTGILTTGTYTIQAVYQGRTAIVPKYFPKSSNTLTQVIYDKKGPDLFRIDMTSAKAIGSSKAPGSGSSFHHNHTKFGRDGSLNSKMLARAKMFFLNEPRFFNEGHYPTGTVSLYDYNTSTGVSTLLGTTSTIGESLNVRITTSTIWTPETYLNYFEINSTDTNITNIVPSTLEYFDSNLTEGDILNVYVGGTKWNPWYDNQSAEYLNNNVVWRLVVKNRDGQQRRYLVPHQLQGVDATATTISDMSTRYYVSSGVSDTQLKARWNSLSTATVTLRLDPRIPTASVEWDPTQANQVGYGERKIYATYSGDTWHTSARSYTDQYAPDTLLFNSTVTVNQYYQPDISTFVAYPKAYLNHSELAVATTSSSRTSPITVTAELFGGAPLGLAKLYVRLSTGGAETEKASAYAANGKIIFPAFTVGAGNWTIIVRIPEDTYVNARELTTTVEKT